MWQKPLRNFVNSIKTYGLLSPDLDRRVQVNQWLGSRPCLSCDEWFRHHWTPPNVPCALPKPLIDFVFDRLEAYSGLTVGCICPDDRLLEDLHFPAICWFDWGITLCDDFYHTFGIDMTDHFDETLLITCADLIMFLHQQLETGSPEHAG
jgi:hypothetical protein